jgi:hypothetical protein
LELAQKVMVKTKSTKNVPKPFVLQKPFCRFSTNWKVFFCFVFANWVEITKMATE